MINKAAKTSLCRFHLSFFDDEDEKKKKKKKKMGIDNGRVCMVPCTWVDGFGTLMKAMDDFLGKENGIGELDLHEREIEGMWQ